MKHERSDKADEDKGRVTSPRKRRESQNRNKELSTTNLQQVKKYLLKSEARSKKERLSISNTNQSKESHENGKGQIAKPSAINSVEAGKVEETLEMGGEGGDAEKPDERNQSNIESPGDIPMKSFYSQPLNDISIVSRKMKQVRAVLTSKDAVVTREEADVEQKEILRENSNKVKEAREVVENSKEVEEAGEVVWAECNEELSNLVTQISEQIDTKVDEDKGGENCAKEESEDSSASREIVKLDETKQIEFNPEWIKDAVRRGQTCYVRIKNECYSTLYGDEVQGKVKKATKKTLKDHTKDPLNKSAEKEGTMKKRSLFQEMGRSKGEEANEKEEAGDGDEVKEKGKRKRSEDSEEESIHPRRKRGAVKYNCDSSDEESDKGNETKHLEKQLAKPRQSISSSSGGGEVESWSSKVFSNDYKDSCQVSFHKSLSHNSPSGCM